jgi:hypothetical protein
MNSLFLVVGCSVILFIRTCVNSLFSPDRFYLSTASLLPLPPIALDAVENQHPSCIFFAQVQP